MAGDVVKVQFRRRHVLQVVVANLFRYLVQGAARSWARNLGGTAPALGSMTLLLLMSGLVGVAGFALYNLEQVEASQASLLHVYLRDDADATDVFNLQRQLVADTRVAGVTYVSKDDALKRAQRMPGLPQLAASTDSNPFPASLDVQVKSIDDVAAIDESVRNNIAIDPVYPTSYDRGAYQRIQNLLFGLAVGGLAFLAMLGFIAVAVTANSIKAAIHSRRDEIGIMQLVGAPRWMVRGPFVIEGAITGTIAGLAAGLITFGLTLAAIDGGSTAFTRFAPGVTLPIAALAATCVLVVGLALGSGSSLISLRRHMES
ncbi:MAG TPA: permease-like cell division protein FtsX [Candidatus Dormibacteraeota bacterium]|nr:permease-like cell division protein FtsX [Candidatus Dormibacteraeota bacterium]